MADSLLISEHSTQHICQVLATLLSDQGLLLTTAESCTGGMIAAACTDLAGSSQWFECGHVTYSNAAKEQMLGVDPGLIALHGAVSEQVARAMAFGAVRRSGASVSVAVTGIAGPTGGNASKPVGTVWFAFSVGALLHSERMKFDGDRTQVRAQAVHHALARLLFHLQQSIGDAGFSPKSPTD